MVEAFGANRGVTPPMRKGIKGSDVRYNINDGFTRDYGATQDSTKRFEAISKTRVLDIEHYLGSDWIDWDCVNYSVNDKSSKKGAKSRAVSSVYRCTKCSRPYQEKVSKPTGSRSINSILSSTMFKNIPLDKGDCGFCG